MDELKDEKWLDELIIRTINTEMPHFDAEKWKQEYPEEYQQLVQRAKQGASGHQPNIWRRSFRNPITRLAVAAAIIVAAGLLMVYRNPPAPQQPQQTVNAVKSPAKMLTAMSLNMAYRRGGIEAVDEQSNKAFEMLGSQPAKISIQELLAESNGV